MFKELKRLCSKHYPFTCDQCPFYVKSNFHDTFHCYISSGLIKPKLWDMFFIEQTMNKVMGKENESKDS